jgi:Sulfotransferase family
MSRINGMISIGSDSDDVYLEKLKNIDRKTQHILGQNYLNTLYDYNKTAKHYADKMPSNFFLVGLINIIFPNAKIIHCTRDPLDNCVSCYTSPLNESHLYAKRLDTLGHYYREYHALMLYWKSVSQIEIFDMPYENTVADLEGSARALIAHVGLPWNDACLKFNEANGRVSTISTWQVRQPIYSTSVKRWKVYEKHLGPLIDALGDLAVTD